MCNLLTTASCSSGGACAVLGLTVSVPFVPVFQKEGLGDHLGNY